ncbi:MAG: response regulator [Nitrospirota bacterium]
MRILIVEDDFISRSLIAKFLAPYGKCDMAVNGREALLAFDMAREEGNPYTLMALDIMLPEIDGHEVLRQIREKEAALKVPLDDCIKVVMTTCLGDSKNMIKSFNSLCEAYLIKPISKDKLIEVIKKLGLDANT